MPLSTLPAEARLRAIELLLLWEGQLSNARLRSLFPVHATQASRDIAAYRKQAPGNIERIEGTKDYAPTLRARPVLTQGVFSEYAQLIGAALPGADLAVGIAAHRVIADQTTIAPEVYRVLHQAIAQGTGVRLKYASMSDPTPHLRELFPHALIQAGPRWHLRAWCCRHGEFRDFNLGRIQQAEPKSQARPISPDEDRGWVLRVSAHLVPHSALTPAQAKLVRQETMQGASALVIEERQALLPYLLQAYRAAWLPERQLPPDYLLQVRNPEHLPEQVLWKEA